MSHLNLISIAFGRKCGFLFSAGGVEVKDRQTIYWLDVRNECRGNNIAMRSAWMDLF